MNKADILEQIVLSKKAFVTARKKQLDIWVLKDKITNNTLPALRPFKKAIKQSIQQHKIAVIAELKKASPSKGLLSDNYNIPNIAAQYEKNGATCLSVLTDEEFFLGRDQDLITARDACQLPILRKDFIIDEYQIYESRIIGADCILLIAAILEKEKLHAFYKLAKELSLDVLIEVTNEIELAHALETEAELIGINNRNLRDFKVDLANTVTLAKKIQDRIIVCESGIKNHDNIEYMLSHDVHVFLVGEALIKSENPGNTLKSLIQG